MKRVFLLAVFLLVFLLSFNITLAVSSDLPQEINYELPYPGLLPDSSLYFLRIIRDKTVGFLISDPLKKAEFDLLQADKRLNAGIYIFNKGEISLALSTISKAENYFGEALDQIGMAKMQGRSINEMEGKLSAALKKHKQELGRITQKANADFIAGFKKEQKRTENFDRWLSH